MFRNRTRGSCTSSAIYLSTCMRALGIPTRTILCIPVLDASDSRELELLDGIRRDDVRAHLRGSLERLKKSWASHTFNEVWVGGRWRRLNYATLGQNIYDRDYFGLLTHVATFRDWADAEFWKTVGRRQKGPGGKDVFGHRNPYSTIALRDHIGVHCTLDIAKAAEPQMRIAELRWTDDERLARDIIDNCKERGRFGLIARIDDLASSSDFVDFVRRCERQAWLRPANKRGASVSLRFDPGCFWVRNGKAWIYLAMSARGKTWLRRKKKYSFALEEAGANAKPWTMDKSFELTRTQAVPR